jgi:hypothetical protein
MHAPERRQTQSNLGSTTLMATGRGLAAGSCFESRTQHLVRTGEMIMMLGHRHCIEFRQAGKRIVDSSVTRGGWSAGAV